MHSLNSVNKRKKGTEGVNTEFIPLVRTFSWQGRRRLKKKYRPVVVGRAGEAAARGVKERWIYGGRIMLRPVFPEYCIPACEGGGGRAEEGRGVLAGRGWHSLCLSYNFTLFQEESVRSCQRQHVGFETPCK